MATYPGGIKTFGTLTDAVDDVLALHQNERGGEITAIEQELGTNPRGVFTDVKDRFKLRGARAFHSVNQTATSGVDKVLAFDSERFDTDGIHDTVTNNSRLTAKTAGKYLISFAFLIQTGTSGQHQIRIRLNGATALAFLIVPHASGINVAYTLTTIYALAVNDYVEVVVNQNSGSNKDVLAAGNYSPEFMMALLET